MAQETELYVKLRILDFKGGPIQHASVHLVQVSARSRLPYGRALEERIVSPRDFVGDFANVPVRRMGCFMLRVTSDPHAQTNSIPFDLSRDNAPEITVCMLRGAVIEGIVVSLDGRPVVGAEVRTTDPDPVCSGLHCVCGLAPELATKTKVLTNSIGYYRLDRLSLGDYKLVVTHADYCADVCLQQIGVEKTICLQPITLRRGCIVEGTVTMDGRPSVGARVVIGPDREADSGEGVPTAVPPEPLIAMTDATGSYKFSQRVPSGAWKIHAVPARPRDQEADVFFALIQGTKSRRPLRVHEGLSRSAVDFALTSQ